MLGASENARGKTVQHKLEMKGTIPPWVLDRLTGVLKDAHPAKFQVPSAPAPKPVHLCKANALAEAAIHVCGICDDIGSALVSECRVPACGRIMTAYRTGLYICDQDDQNVCALVQMVAETAPLSGSFNVQPEGCASEVKAPLSVLHPG